MSQNSGSVGRVAPLRARFAKRTTNRGGHQLSTGLAPRENPTGGGTVTGSATPPHPSRYAELWDSYSNEWDREPHYDQYRFLGDEWGDDNWVRHNLDTFVFPYITPTAKVLEIGPGGGRYTEHVRARCDHLVGVDVSRNMIARLNKRFAETPNTSFILGDGRHLSQLEDSSIDFAFAFNVFVQLDLEHIYGYLVELARVLKPGATATLQYAQITGVEGWKYFTNCYATWALNPLARGRFCELSLGQMELLAERAGLACRRNQIVARDGVIVLERRSISSSSRASDAPSTQTTRRNFRLIENYLDALAEDVYHEIPTDHHRAAAHDATDTLVADLEVKHAIEFGCGAAPGLDQLAKLGIQTLGVTIGEEPCAHEVVHSDMHFTGLAENSTDLILARHIVEHSPMPLLLLMEIARVTRRYALVIVPCDEEIWVNWKNHYSVFSKAMWKKLFDRAGFKLLKETDGPLVPDSTEWRFLLELRTR